ncbi:MAG: Tat pathway signal protein, partial [Caulobacterales bacterium 68-7]
MSTRRQFLAASAAASALAGAPGLAMAQAATGGAEKLNALFDVFMAENLRAAPESATSLGLDKDGLAWTKSALADFSLAARADSKALTASQLTRLRAIDRTPLSAMDQVNYDTVEFVLATEDAGNRQFDFGANGAGEPYVLSQLGGAYYSKPDFLDAQHSIENRADADAYIARLSELGRRIDDDSERAAHDMAQGVVPPDFAIDKALIQLRQLNGQSAADNTLTASIARRVKEKGIAGDHAEQAARLLEEKIRPSLSRQIALLEKARVTATHDAGIWKLKDGAAYYQQALRASTTAEITPDEVHRIGLELVASLSAEADRLMKKAGYSKGTVGHRYRAMYDDPKQHYPNTDAGKQQLIDDLNARVKATEARLPEYFGTLPKARLEIRRVPAATEAGAPLGYYNSPTIDGSRPGIYWINLRDTAEQPRFVLPTLTYHEGTPGHHLEGALTNEAKGLPLIRKAIWFSGYGEGWALYAEQLAVEMGVYKDDPLGHIGMLHDATFRAVRLVVDSGMHAKRWSREQALKYYIDNIGDAETAAITEIERYAVWPGQACSYMVGKLTWLRLREK